MLTEQGHVKVLDFGVAKRLPLPGAEQDLTQTATVDTSATGALPYMSPEQIRNRKVDTRSDLFSLGTLLYEMLTGVHPFRRESPMETAASVLNEEPPAVGQYVDGIGPPLQDALKRLLAKDPAQRYQSVEELRSSLTLEPVPPSGTGSRLKESILRLYTKRKQQLPWLALPLTVFLGLAIEVYWSSPGTVSDPPVLRFGLELPDERGRLVTVVAPVNVVFELTVIGWLPAPRIATCPRPSCPHCHFSS